MYAKVFASLWNGSLRGHANAQLVLVYMCSNCDIEGVFDVHPQAIADATGLSLGMVGLAVQILESRDPESRSPEHDGQRIIRLDEHRTWGWLIVNYQKYRNLQDAQTLRALNRIRVARCRAKQSVTAGNASVMVGNARQRQRQKHKQKDKDLSAAPTLESLELPLPGTKRGVAVRKVVLTETLPEGEITAVQAFDQIFWPEYPRKVAVQAARKAWKGLNLKDTDTETIVAIMSGLRRDIKGEWADRELKVIPHASTWLNQRRWEG